MWRGRQRRSSDGAPPIRRRRDDSRHGRRLLVCDVIDEGAGVMTEFLGCEMFSEDVCAHAFCADDIDVVVIILKLFV